VSDINENDFPPLEPQPFVTEEGREVERLRAELAAMKKQRDAADEECREATASWCSEANETLDLYRELAAMRKQRDEARRDACAFQGIIKFNLQHPNGIISTEATLRLAKAIAAERGWDCYKEGGGA
jgi:uncharacterized coiled-coil DUF342 family protein